MNRASLWMCQARLHSIFHKDIGVLSNRRVIPKLKEKTTEDYSTREGQAFIAPVTSLNRCRGGQRDDVKEEWRDSHSNEENEETATVPLLPVPMSVTRARVSLTKIL
ncbi:uncharacterized protein EAE97_000764 [Botrytis byssoidea]|uniref:Uncharacterized protein n=1 Tax=Botrytis byssoidea TaxID=139641 RepID=A0A9P5J0F8_9HELO|nr:uncharacterized protein EAE97_000764 [Botrytis byssoidea]KAF7955505.1 hypothetical protein EAE97_000764 [Botrytis byssoidea]